MSHTSDTMSLHAHIKELRGRLFIVALIFIIASAVAYMFADPIYSFLTVPLGDEKLYNTTVGGGFSFILQIILWVGIAVTLPVLIVMLYGFIAPILPTHAKRKTSLVFTLSMSLFVAGAAFGYYFAMPGAMRFLLNFADGKIIPIITGDSYLHFLLAYTIGTGILFQIPLLMMIINWISPLNPKKLFNFERYVIVAAFVLAAIITPTPDPVNQTIIAAPVVAMYQVGFLAVATSQRNTRKRALSSKQTAVSIQSTAPQHPPQPLVYREEAKLSPVPVHAASVATPRSIDGISRRVSARPLRPIPQPSRTIIVQPRRYTIQSIDGIRSYPRSLPSA